MRKAVAGHRTLDVHCYDIDALLHIEDILLAGRFEADILDLATHFLPTVAAVLPTPLPYKSIVDVQRSCDFAWVSLDPLLKRTSPHRARLARFPPAAA